MFSCTHCGFLTRYEVELQNHMKLHYLWILVSTMGIFKKHLILFKIYNQNDRKYDFHFKIFNKIFI